MKKSLALLAFIAIVFFARAQKPQPFNPKNYDHVDPKKDQRVIQGYTVRLRPGFNFTYLFDILDKDKLVHEPTHNVLNSYMDGYATKEDAYTAAAWVIDQFKKTGHIPPILPPDMTEKLKPNPNPLHQ